MADGVAKTREVADGVVEVFLPLPMPPSIVNVWLVRGGAEWTLVDTGMNTTDAATAFLGALDEVGIAPATIRRIISTHHHVDHFGRAAPLKALTRAEVYLHPSEAERAAATGEGPFSERTAWLRRLGVPPAPDGQEMPPVSRWLGTVYKPVPPDRLIADGDEIPLGDGRTFEVVWTPGHTAGHCCLLLHPDGVLFVGDHLLPKITPHVGVYPGGPEDPLGDFLASHVKIERLDARLVCPAHGAVYEDHRRRARQLVDFHKVRMHTMLEIIRRGPKTPYEVALEAFAISPDNRFQVLAATSETLAHLERLRRQGKALRDEPDGTVRYRGR
jgi:glyoxylase-like metal-dependent hydrolase (beta-lactamase superfamily II)